MEKLGLSARAYDRILKVARAIADLDNSEKLKRPIWRKRYSIEVWIEKVGGVRILKTS